MEPGAVAGRPTEVTKMVGLYREGRAAGGGGDGGEDGPACGAGWSLG